METHEKIYLTIAEVAELLIVSRRWVQARIKDGSIPHVRLGPARRLIRFKRDDVLKFGESHRPPSDGDAE